MTWQAMAAVIVVFLVVVGLLALNRRPKASGRAEESGGPAPRSSLNVVIGILVGVVFMGVTFAGGRDGRGLEPLILVAAVTGISLALAFRKLIWFYLRAILARRRRRIARKNADGQWEIKCLKCSHNVVLTPERAGNTAYECPHCGEKRTWASESKS